MNIKKTSKINIYNMAPKNKVSKLSDMIPNKNCSHRNN